MKFAVFTVSLPDWTPDVAAAELAAAGYDGVEWRVIDQNESADGTPGFWAGNRCTWPQSTLLADTEAIAACAAGAGLAMPALGTYVTCEEPGEVDTVMRAARALGIGKLRVRLPNYDPADSFRAVWQRRRAEFANVAALAAEHGVRALVEIHHRTPVASPHAAARFVADFDPAQVGVIHDIGNMVYEGWSDYREGFEVLGEHLGHVHLKNARWEPDGLRVDGSTAWVTNWAGLRTGIVDLTAFFGALNQIGYDDWVTIEDFSTEQPLADRVRDNLVAAKAALDAARGAAA